MQPHKERPKTIINNVTRANYAQRLLYLDGKPFTIKAVPYMEPIINCSAEKILLMTGRQVGKSTELSADLIVEQTSTPHYRSLYVAPRGDQVTQFSGDRLAQMINYSPVIQNLYIDSKCYTQVQYKSFSNGSAIFLRSCFHNADGIRGISANSVKIDEVQDIIIDNIPVIEECTARRSPKKMTFCGTPKTLDNGIQKMWDQTTQHYWAIKCTRCNRWAVPIGIENLQPQGLACAHCSNLLNVASGQYVATFPTRKFVGFHISQAMVAGVPGTGIPWNRLYDKVNDPLYGVSKLYNECLGFSYDNGAKLLTTAEVVRCCDPLTEGSLDRKDEWGMYVVCAAVDWGVLGGNTHSVVTIGGMDRGGKLRVLYVKKFPVDQDPTIQINEIVSIIVQAGASIVVADRGGGSFANSFLRSALPKHITVHEIEYKARVLAGMKYNIESKSWITDRTRAMSGVIIDIKRQNIIFPMESYSKDFFSDLLTLMCEYNDRIRAFQIIRDSNTPDDVAHTLVYLRIGCKYLSRNPRATEHVLEEFTPPNKVDYPSDGISTM